MNRYLKDLLAVSSAVGVNWLVLILLDKTRDIIKKDSVPRIGIEAVAVGAWLLAAYCIAHNHREGLKSALSIIRGLSSSRSTR